MGPYLLHSSIDLPPICLWRLINTTIHIASVFNCHLRQEVPALFRISYAIVSPQLIWTSVIPPAFAYNECLSYTARKARVFVFVFIRVTALQYDLFFSGSSSPFFTDGRNPWTSVQSVARPLPKHRTAQIQIKHIHTPDIHALSGIRTHDSSVRASECSLCLRLRGYCDRLTIYIQ
jgi:hypothetical protein